MKYAWGQGAGGLEETADDQPSKRQKLEDTGDSDVRKENAVAGGAPTISGLRKPSAGETLTQGGVTQLSSKPTRSHPRSSLGIVPGHPSSAAWGPARFKLDNRPSVFRILPPLPAAVSEVVFYFHQSASKLNYCVMTDGKAKL